MFPLQATDGFLPAVGSDAEVRGVCCCGCTRVGQVKTLMEACVGLAVALKRDLHRPTSEKGLCR